MLLVTLFTHCLLPSLVAPFPPFPFFSINNLLCHSCSAGQVSLVSTPVLICYATAIPLYTSHWSTSAEFSITLSFLPSSLPPLPPVLFDLILSLSEICFSLLHATEVFFYLWCLSREHRVCSIRKLCVRPTSDLSIFPFRGGLFSQCCTHSVGIAISICH